jgi:hypothetical protein
MRIESRHGGLSIYKSRFVDGGQRAWAARGGGVLGLRNSHARTRVSVWVGSESC